MPLTRRRRNPTVDLNKPIVGTINWGTPVEIVGGIAGVGAAALGAPRTAGLILTGTGLYDAFNRRPGYGALYGALGLGLFFLPELRALKGNGTFTSLPASKPPPVQLNIPLFERVSFPNLDRMLDGDWRMLDVRDIRGPNVAAKAQNLKPGDVASLVLQNKNGPYLVYNARVISGGGGLVYAAQWASQPPVGGPQMIDFSQEHVFATH